MRYGEEEFVYPGSVLAYQYGRADGPPVYLVAALERTTYAIRSYEWTTVGPSDGGSHAFSSYEVAELAADKAVIKGESFCCVVLKVGRPPSPGNIPTTAVTYIAMQNWMRDETAPGGVAAGVALHRLLRDLYPVPAPAPVPNLPELPDEPPAE